MGETPPSMVHIAFDMGSEEYENATFLSFSNFIDPRPFINAIYATYYYSKATNRSLSSGPEV